MRIAHLLLLNVAAIALLACGSDTVNDGGEDATSDPVEDATGDVGGDAEDPDGGADAAEDPDDATDPDATDPDATDPDATDPDATDPDATDPDATDAPDAGDDTQADTGEGPTVDADDSSDDSGDAADAGADTADTDVDTVGDTDAGRDADADTAADADADTAADADADTNADADVNTDADADAGPDAVDADSGDAADGDASSGSCLEDDECAPDGWCRAAELTGDARECVPFVGEGAFCGGFTLPTLYQRCKPDLACVVADPDLVDAPGRCLTWVSAAVLEADPESYDGLLVAVEGLAGIDAPLCTAMMCSDEAPCCNTCAGDEVLIDSGITLPPAAASVGLIDPDEGRYGCGGTNCDPTATCTVEAGVRYRVIGRYDAGEGAIVVDSIHRAGVF